MMKMKKYLMIVMAGLVLALPVKAADFDKGFEAYQRGDYATALAELMPLAEAGDAEAQHNLGLMYYEGQGVLQHDAEALKWIRLAAEQGYAKAQTDLGLMYAGGLAVSHDFIAAHVWLNIAAANGDTKAAEKRDYVARNWSHEDRNKAQSLAKKCLDSNYQDCP